MMTPACEGVALTLGRAPGWARTGQLPAVIRRLMYDAASPGDVRQIQQARGDRMVADATPCHADERPFA